MFQKNHSSTLGNPPTNATTTKNNNTKNVTTTPTPTTKTKRIETPLKKSERRKVLSRVWMEVLDRQLQLSSTLPSSEENNQNAILTSTRNHLQELLQDIFLQGTLTLRTLPWGKNQMVHLYMRGPGVAGMSKQESQMQTRLTWPYHQSTHCVWIALVEKGMKNEQIISETPSVALWSVLSSAIMSMNCKEKDDEVDNNSFPLDILQNSCVQVPSPVSKYVCQGASLMKAGMRSIPSAWSSLAQDCDTKNKSRMVPICIQGNPQPFAVGELVLKRSSHSSSQAASSSATTATTPSSLLEEYGVGTKGIGVQVWNCYGDDLWRQSRVLTNTSNTISKGNNKDNNKNNPSTMNVVGGAPWENGHYGNVGFQNGAWVLPIYDVDTEDDDDEEEEDEHSELQEAKDEYKKHQSQNSSNDDDDSIKAKKKEDQEETAVSAEAQFHLGVLHALMSTSNKSFPIPTMSFANLIVTTNDTENTKLHIKETSYKKWSRYLQLQSDRGLIQAGPDPKNKANKDPWAVILGYNKKHDDFEGVERPLSSSAESTSNVAGSPLSTKLVLVSLFTIPQQWVSLLHLSKDDVKAMNASSKERQGSSLLTWKEAQTLLEKYMDQESVLVTRGEVTLDAGLTAALFPKVSNPPTLLMKKELLTTFRSLLGTGYALVEMPGSRMVQLARGKPPMIDIEVVRRQSNKFVTYIRGLEKYGIVNVPDFATDLSRRLACACTVETSDSIIGSGRPGLAKNCSEVILQGNWANDLEALLCGDDQKTNHGGVKGSPYAIPAKVINIILRKGVPGGKKKKK